MRFLKAKVRVMQEELDKIGDLLANRDDECRGVSVKLKQSDDERARLQRQYTTKQVGWRRSICDVVGKINLFLIYLSYSFRRRQISGNHLLTRRRTNSIFPNLI